MGWFERSIAALHHHLVELPAGTLGELAVALVTGLLLLGASTLVVLRWVARMPADYFTRAIPPRAEHPLAAGLLLLARNAGGSALLIAGAVMALPGVPGPGLATMFIGFALLDFPGKRRIELRLLSRPRIRSAIDHLRARHGQPPLELPAAHPTAR